MVAPERESQLQAPFCSFPTADESISTSIEPSLRAGGCSVNGAVASYLNMVHVR